MCALPILCVIAVGCGGIVDNDLTGDAEIPVAGKPGPTTAVAVAQAPAEEREKFSEMYDDAMEDGVISVSELKLFALETVECIRRAGFDASFSDLDPQTGNITFGVAAEGPDDTSGELETDACFEVFYNTPWEQFKRQGPGSTGQ